MEFLQNLLFAVISAAVPVVTMFICQWLQSIYNRNQNKIKDEKLASVLAKVTDIVTEAVETTTSTYVKGLKAENLFDEKAHKKAFKMTYDAVKKQITDDTAAIISEEFGDIEVYLTNKIESLVEHLKK